MSRTRNQRHEPLGARHRFLRRYGFHGMVVVMARARMAGVGPFFFFNDTATTEIYTLSLHDALPICRYRAPSRTASIADEPSGGHRSPTDRKSTRLNSSHVEISYAVFCLKKKKKYYVVVCLVKKQQQK